MPDLAGQASIESATEPPTEARRALDEAIEVCGGRVSKFAEAIGERQSAVHNWRIRGSVPAGACPAIERETTVRGRPVRCERFRPDVDWDFLRNTSLQQQLATA